MSKGVVEKPVGNGDAAACDLMMLMLSLIEASEGVGREHTR
jgi:hypothetical protein